MEGGNIKNFRFISDRMKVMMYYIDPGKESL